MLKKTVALAAAGVMLGAFSADAADYGGLYSGRGYDAIFETSGSPAAFRMAVGLLRPLGAVMALGFIPSVEFGLKQITLKAAQIMGSIGGTGEFDRVLEFVAGYPELASQLVSHRVPFDEADRGELILRPGATPSGSDLVALDPSDLARSMRRFAKERFGWQFSSVGQGGQRASELRVGEPKKETLDTAPGIPFSRSLRC